MDIDFCVASSAAWQLVGYFLYALKVAIPVIIIILGTVDFVNALIASDDKKISGAAKSLIMRLVMGIVVFFVPVLVSAFLHLVKNANKYLKAADTCQTCLLRPFNSSCEAAKSKAKAQLTNGK